MTSPSESLALFSDEDRAALEQYLRDSPNARRLTPERKGVWIQWLTNSDGRSLSQTEHNQRHYIRKTFVLDPDGETISTRPREEEERARLVVTTDKIADMVEVVHVESGHRGWDATWKDVSSSYYGILRADVIFLLQRCPICLRDPRKRPKAGARAGNADE
jgi:hypothetical protein